MTEKEEDLQIQDEHIGFQLTRDDLAPDALGSFRRWLLKELAKGRKSGAERGEKRRGQDTREQRTKRSRKHR